MEKFLAWVAPRHCGEARLHLAGYVDETVIYVAEPSPKRVPGLMIGCLSRAEWATVEPLEAVFLDEMVELTEPGLTLSHCPGGPDLRHADISRIHWRSSLESRSDSSRCGHHPDRPVLTMPRGARRNSNLTLLRGVY